MKSSRRAVSSPSESFPERLSSHLSTWPWWVACALSWIVAIFPDERLTRLKLLGLESGVLVLVALVGAKIIFDTQRENWGALVTVAFPPLLFCAIQAVLWWMASERSLATVEMRRVLLTTASFLVFAVSSFCPIWRRRFLWCWSLAAGFVAVYAILQRSGGMGVLLVPQMDRPIGTFGNPIFLAAYLLISSFVAIQCGVHAQRSFSRMTAAALVVLMLFALILTQTRAAWIGVVVAAFVGILFSVPHRKVKVGLLLGLMGLGLLFAWTARSTVTRDQAHLLIWRDTLRMWKAHPLMGVGPGAFHVYFPDYAQADLQAKWPNGSFIVNDAHNEYLQQLAEGGLVGFLSWCLIPMVFVIVLLARPIVRQQWGWLCAGAVGLAAQNIFSVDMRFGVSASLAAMVMGVVVGVGFAERETKPRRPSLTIIVPPLLWCGVVLVGVFPSVWKPYLASRQLSRSPGFFDQRLLEPAKNISDLQALSEQYPAEPSILEKLAFVYAKQIRTTDNELDLGMADKAIATYEKVLTIDPTRASSANNLANIHYTLAHVDRALEIWQQTIAKNPAALDARLNLGKVLYAKGRLKEAAMQFDEVLRQQPGNAEATVYLKRMVE